MSIYIPDNSSDYINQADLTSESNKCVKKTQLTTNGAVSGVVQLDSSGILAVPIITGVSSGSVMIQSNAAAQTLLLKKTSASSSVPCEIVFLNSVNTGLGAVGGTTARGVYLWNGIDKVSCYAGASGAVDLTSTTSVNIVSPILNVFKITSAQSTYTAGSGAGQYTLGTGAGTSPGAVTVSGSDASGSISVLTGTTPSSGASIITIRFAVPYPTGSHVVVTGCNDYASFYNVNVTSTNSSFTLSSQSTGPLTASQTAIWKYMAHGY